MKTYGQIILDTQEHKVIYDGKKIDLSHSDCIVMEVFLQHPDRLFSIEEVLRILSQTDININKSIIKECIDKLNKAFMDNGYPGAIIESINSTSYRYLNKNTDDEKIFYPSLDVFKKSLLKNSIEYIVINERHIIQYCSPEALNYSDYPEDLNIGETVYESFPEFIGLEYIFEEMLTQKRDIFELRCVGRSCNHNRPEYINIYVTSEHKNLQQASYIFILFEDTSEEMNIKQKLVQYVNETLLLLEHKSQE